MTIIDEIKKPKERIFRRAYVKRRLKSTGLFEDDWQEITRDVKRWGKIKVAADDERTLFYNFTSLNVQVANDEGTYNPEDDESSLWYDYASLQRSLFKIETGFLHATLASSGIWSRTEYPTNSTSFVGVISGDIYLTDKNTVTIKVKPLLQIFQDYPARNLNYTSTGYTASEFLDMVWDHQDADGSYVFRPFFGNTTSNWLITTTTTNYINLNTSTSDDVIDSTCWEIVEKLAETENYVPYISKDGKFSFGPKTIASSTSYEFYGAGNYNTEYGHTIKKINKYGQKITKYYSRVQIKFKDEDTSTAYALKEATLTVSGENDPWNYGHRTLEIENFWMQTSSVADPIAQSLFDEYSTLKNEIQFTTSFIPHLSPLERIAISYDSTSKNPASRWDLNDWDTELIWDDSSGDAIKLDGAEFKSLSIELNLDKLETKFTARET